MVLTGRVKYVTRLETVWIADRGMQKPKKKNDCLSC